MSLNKLNYVDQVTVIPASNLNDIQDAIIELEGDVGEIETEIEGKADADSVYTKTEADALLNAKADSSAVYTKTETDTLLSGKASESDLEELQEEMADYRQMYLDSLIHTTASGSIASFSDGADGLPMDYCTAIIEPKQEGSGDPSPTNVRPISGSTGTNVVRDGQNNLTNGSREYSLTTSDYASYTPCEVFEKYDICYVQR